MSGQSLSTSYAPVPTSEAVPLTTYSPSPTHQQQQLGGYTHYPRPLKLVSQPVSAPAYPYPSSFSVPPSSSASQTTLNDLEYSCSPNTAAHEQLPSVDQHDFTPGPHKSDSDSWSYISFPPPNVKRFSRAWWRYIWKDQVNRRKLPRLLYSLTGVVLLVIWIGISTAFANNIEYTEARNSYMSDNQSFRGISSDGLLLVLQGQLNSFDPQARNLNVDWSAKVIQGPTMSNDLSTINQVPAEVYNTTIAIFRDTVARKDTGINSTDLGYTPFRLRNPAIQPVGYLGVSDFDSINTIIPLGQREKSIWTQPEFGYPFDIFKGTITFVAADNDTITSSGRPGSGVLRMEGAILTDNLLNIKIRPSTDATCRDENGEGCELIIDIRAERTGLVKFCVIVVFFISWAVTISIFLVTGEALLLHRKDILEGTDILAVCFTALFALPTVRSLLPGVPDYGCMIDLFGILPCIIVLALCTAFFANSRLHTHARQNAEARVTLDRASNRLTSVVEFPEAAAEAAKSELIRKRHDDSSLHHHGPLRFELSLYLGDTRLP